MYSLVFSWIDSTPTLYLCQFEYFAYSRINAKAVAHYNLLFMRHLYLILYTFSYFWFSDVILHSLYTRNLIIYCCLSLLRFIYCLLIKTSLIIFTAIIHYEYWIDSLMCFNVYNLRLLLSFYPCTIIWWLLHELSISSTRWATIERTILVWKINSFRPWTARKMEYDVVFWMHTKPSHSSTFLIWYSISILQFELLIGIC